MAATKAPVALSSVEICALYAKHLGVTISSADVHELPAASQGEFNTIHRISHPAYTRSPRSYLRVSKPLIPHRKTRNEVASLALVHERLPPSLSSMCPRILAFDAAGDAEWTILSEVPGVPLLDVFDPTVEQHVDAVVTLVIQLQTALWTTCRTQHLGGLQLEDGGRVVPGPVVTFDMWDLSKLHHLNHETFEEWNPAGPFDTEAAYIRARLERDLRVVRAHPSCSALRNRVGDTKTFEDALAAALRVLAMRQWSGPGFALSHRDLHLGNFLASKEQDESLHVTGILDWELAQCMPLDRREPGNTLRATTALHSQHIEAMRARLFDELNQVQFESSREAISANEERQLWWSLVGLTYWIVYRTVDLGTETRLPSWLEKWWAKLRDLKVI